ncbi:MAG: hypothetical protein DIU60_010335 [Actinomycetes bacterium]|nr:MAG: hypothetical protein DIU60_13680 [Actinomycetota bacterium]
MSHALRRTVALISVALLALAGCGDGDSDEPTAAEAGATLKQHITQLLERVRASDITVTDPGGKNIPCGEGRAMQTYGATGVDNFGSGDPAGLVTNMVGGLTALGDYTLADAELGETKRELVSATARTRIILESPAEKRYVVTGRTECLPIG